MRVKINWPLRVLLPIMVLLAGFTVILGVYLLGVAASAILVAIVAALFWYVLNRILINPLRKLRATAQAFINDELTVSANLSSNNELGEISRALDAMAVAAYERKLVLNRSLQLEQIIEESANEIYVIDATTYKVLTANRAARNNLGYTIEETKQLVPWDFVDGQTQSGIEELVAPLREGTIKDQGIETGHRRKDGTVYPAAVQLQYMEKQQPPVFFAIVQDITEREAWYSELLLRNRAIAEVDTGILIADASNEDYPIVYVNAAMESISGYSAADILGRNPRFLQGEDRDQPELHKIRSALQAAVPVTVLLRNYRKDGTLFMNEVSISPIRDKAGTLTHFIGAQRDVTAKLETDARLLQAQKIDAVGQLSGGIAHDFNNLLMVILWNLEMLKTDPDDKDRYDIIDEADRAAKMGARLTRRLLNFARQGALTPSVVNVNEQISNAIGLLRSTIGETISISSNLAANLWSTRVDPSEIENTVVNLAINARDAMPGGGRLCIKTSNTQIVAEDSVEEFELSPGNYIKISVSDNGSGMTSEVKARIFEPFFSTKEVGKGTGLGLASLYGFAKQSGGHVYVESEVGHGTTVSLFLPQYAESQVEPKKFPPSSVHEQWSNNRPRILVVEDNEMVRKSTTRRLASLDFEVSDAADGDEAIKLLEVDKNIDLVLTDIVMAGGTSGYDLAGWIEKNRHPCKVLLVSGLDGKITSDGNSRSVALPVLNKPYGLAELRLAIDTELRASSSCIGQSSS